MSPKVVAKARSAVERFTVSPLARRLRSEGLTYLSWRKLRTLERHAKRATTEGVPGDFVEAGIALGGSGILLASLMGTGRTFRGYDVFGQIPPPGEKDDERAHHRYATIASGRATGLKGGQYYGYVNDLYDRVVENFESHGVPVDGSRAELVRGTFEDALFPPGPVALAHIDADWYDSVKLCLERIGPWVSEGGVVIFDDYDDYGGCAKAVDEFLAAQPEYEPLGLTGSYVIRRRGSSRAMTSVNPLT